MLEDLLSLNLETLTEHVLRSGWPKYYAKIIWQGLYQRQITTWDELTNLPLNVRKQLSDLYHISPLTLQTTQTSRDGTSKYLYYTSSNNPVESVLIPNRDSATLCLSTQSGCKLNCRFCLTGDMGFRQNLSAGEILGQIVGCRWSKHHSDYSDVTHPATSDQRPATNLVFMGMGEPFDNYDNLIKTIEIIHDPDGLNYGWRRMTVSTCGIIPKMRDFINRYPEVNLAISLHSPDDTVRTNLMPINRKYPVAELIAKGKKFAVQTGRRISWEYIYLPETNDRNEDVQALARAFAHDPLMHLNIIKYHQTAGNHLKPGDVESFINILQNKGINVTLRQSRGADISAACGQLGGESPPQIFTD